MAQLLAISLLVLSLGRAAVASPCIVFDTRFNLLAFGFGDKDWSAGNQDNWSTSSAAVDITNSGRPSFDGPNTTCYLSQFTNAVYVMGADSANPSSVYIFDASAKSWSNQAVTKGSFDPSSFDAILDHDTNVFYAVAHGELFYLDMKSLKTATSTSLPWVDVQKVPFNADSYSLVMALAQNHIHFLNVPGVPVGSAKIFVIHFSYFQPEPQAYPIIGGGNFPATHGQATSFFQTDGVQQEFAFIPDDGSATYVINVETNSTQSLAGPTIKDPKATYFAGITSLVQLSTTGNVSFLPYLEGKTDANHAAHWASVKPLANLPISSTTTAHSRPNPTTSSSTTRPTGTTSHAIRAATYCLSTVMAFGGVVLFFS